MSAPKGNQFAKGMGGGRPPKFKTPVEMQELIDVYFASLEVPAYKEIPSYTKPALVTGLALALGFCDRQSMYDYEKKEEFSCTIKEARTRVEASYEEYLFSKSSTGAIFGLKNMGWSDKQEVQHSGEIKNTGVTRLVTKDTLESMTKEDKDDIGFIDS